MLFLNEDILLLILEELKDDKKSLYSCLLVNRTWCITAVPILWKNPSQYFITKNAESMLFDVILLHLPEESRYVLKNLRNNNLITETYQRPLFNYIDFWKYLNLSLIERIISSKIKKYNVSIIRNEILKLFINRNTKFTHISIPQGFVSLLHHIPGNEHCFSALESFHCDVDIDPNILEGFARICKSIKELRFHFVNVYNNDNSGIIKLIEAQKNLNDVNFIYNSYLELRESFSKSLEESLIKHADTIQYLRIDWKPATRILSYLVNLLSLDINMQSYSIKSNEFNHLENLSLPILKILKAQRVPSKILSNLIESTKGHLFEISIRLDYDDDERLIHTIYQNCPNLRHLRLSLVDNDNINSIISAEFEDLLINCQFLNVLVIDTESCSCVFRWDKLFEILTRSSPISLFKFKFHSYFTIKLDHLKLFFDNWKNRNPLLLKLNNNPDCLHKLEYLIKEYIAKGIIKKYFNGFDEDFEWI